MQINQQTVAHHTVQVTTMLKTLVLMYVKRHLLRNEFLNNGSLYLSLTPKINTCNTKPA